MTKKILVLALILPVILLGQHGKDFTLSPGRAGRIQIGMTVDSLYLIYPRNQAKLIDLNLEGFFTPAIEWTVPGFTGKKASVILEIGWNRTWIINRITVIDTRFRTVTGIGVGSPLGDLRRNHHVDWIDFGEGALVARVDSLGMGFQLRSADVAPAWYQKRDMKIISDSLIIKAVIIH